jgi:hypothetical protein
MSHGIESLVGESEKSLFDSLGFENLFCLSMEGEERFSQGIVLHFDIRPLDAISKASSNGFEKGLLGCEPNGKTFGGAGPFLTPDDFSLRKDPTKEEVSPTSHHTFDPFDIHDVDAISNNHKFGVISCIVN